jgi:hypothetical protein
LDRSRNAGVAGDAAVCEAFARMVEPTKQCPDCAEQVLAAARVCRYCRYRFDSDGRNRGAVGDLLGMLRGDGSARTLADVLADWGVRLAAEDEVRFFRLAEVDGEPGYLLVTEAKLAFFAQRGRRSYDKLFEVPVAGISEIESSGRGRGRRLALTGPGGDHLVRAFGRDLEWLRECLTSAADAG